MAINEALNNYTQDTENPEYNFYLAVEYEILGQTASAISYYLRAADRKKDTVLAYESLIRASYCFNKQGNRWYTVKSLLHNAITVMPNRPEAYYILARHEERSKNYFEAYSLSNTGLTFCDFDLEPLITDVEYPGKWGLIYEKAVSSYWWGKSQECRKLFKILLDEHYDLMDETHKKSVRDNFNTLGMDFPYNNINKLEGFPSVYYLSLEESVDRRENLENQFKELGITNINPIISKRFKECNDVIHGKYVHSLTDASKGCCTSHMRCIKKWLDETDEEYGFFCEDDLSLETVKYWNFAWNDFIDYLPEDWECVQLMWVRDEMTGVSLRERYFNDWAATAYILKRNRAKKIIDTYYRDGEFYFDIPDCEAQPIIENLVFSLGKVYTFPLFVEEVKKFDTCILVSEEFDKLKDDWVILDGQGPSHISSYHQIVNWWQNEGCNLKINQIPK